MHTARLRNAPARPRMAWETIAPHCADDADAETHRRPGNSDPAPHRPRAGGSEAFATRRASPATQSAPGQGNGRLKNRNWRLQIAEGLVNRSANFQSQMPAWQSSISTSFAIPDAGFARNPTPLLSCKPLSSQKPTHEAPTTSCFLSRFLIAKRLRFLADFAARKGRDAQIVWRVGVTALAVGPGAASAALLPRLKALNDTDA